MYFGLESNNVNNAPYVLCRTIAKNYIKKTLVKKIAISKSIVDFEINEFTKQILWLTWLR